MDNKELARVLWETADLMEIAGEDGFRIRSYRNGATAIEGHPESIAAILKDPSRKVTEISGIGKGLAAILAEIEETGSCERRNALLEKYPAGGSRIPQNSRTRAQEHRPVVRALPGRPPWTSSNNYAAIKSSAICRAWARSSKKRSFVPSRSTGSEPGVSFLASPSRPPMNS